MKTDPKTLKTVLVTDCGSTTTKALLFERGEDRWKQSFRGEAPTTVEAPVADVTVGAQNAFREIQEISKRKILSGTESTENHPFEVTTQQKSEGIDLYLSTSSAGGGLQMLVGGVVKEMTTESAERAALGAGAIVLDALSADDGREDHERIERIRHIRPDIVLLTGGVDGGSSIHVLEMAEVLLAASPRPRFGDTLQLPVIYAGNNEVADEVAEILDPIARVSIVDNVRPTLDQENLVPAREAIHEFFLSHVMSHSPGYGKLMSWSPISIMPTPAAVGNMVEEHARRNNQQVLCVDIGGATTDLFSVFRDTDGRQAFNRTVSANLGMSYSVANVLLETGVENIARWLSVEMEASDIRDRLRNKMIRPTSIPQTLEDLWLEQAVCREALRLSLQHHRSLAVGLSGVQRQRGIAEIFSQHGGREELVNLLELDLVIGSGGVLSHAPHRLQSALMMLEGFGLEGVTQITVDSIFMMPHLGVLASLHPEAAQEIFVNDCLINVALAVVPLCSRAKKFSGSLADVFVDGKKVATVEAGVLKLLQPESSGNVTVRVVPLHSSISVTSEPGQAYEQTLEIGEYGLILDGRNRPLPHSDDPAERQRQRAEVFAQLGLKED